MIAYLIGALVLLGMGFSAGWTTDEWKTGAVRAKELEAAQAALVREQAHADLVGRQFEVRLAALRVVNTTVNREVRHEIETKVYGDPGCSVPESGRQLRDRAIDAANGGTGAAPALPAPRAGAGPPDNGRPLPGGFGPNREVWGVSGAAPGLGGLLRGRP